MLWILALLVSSAAAARLGDVTRLDTGDGFTLIGDECNAAQCAEHGARLASNSVSFSDTNPSECQCSCPQRAPLFREDRELCVDDLPECSLATFGTGIGVQRIPFVFLPMKGQILHPSKEITFQGVKTPICAVSGAQFMTQKGFLDLRNTLDADVPFSLFRDEGRTFLQWTGEDDVRTSMSGRVMVVRLLCRDVSAPPASPLDLRGVFTPCVAFRVQGTPPRQLTNVTEVQFAPNAQTSEITIPSKLSITEYVAIGISSLILGLIYVASVFLYLHIRKQKNKTSEDTATAQKRLKGLRKKDGSIITERDIVRINNERVQTLSNPLDSKDVVVKSNPLLTLGQQFHDIKTNFTSDSGSNVSDSEDFSDHIRNSDSVFKSQTSAVVHSYNELNGYDLCHRDESNIERLPDEHVSIVETTDDREIARPVGTTRRKLYFNPAYFDLQLMAEPPPAALEFLVKIREVIAIAKHKMELKRFQPILNHIPEEETHLSIGNSIDLYQGLGSQRSSSVISLKRENSRKKSVTCLGCPGCKSDSSNNIESVKNSNTATCSNCLGSKSDKQNSVRKWLENIQPEKLSSYNELLTKNKNTTREQICKIKKQNSFSACNSMHVLENVSGKLKPTMSVRSEPALRNLNLPLPEFNSNEWQTQNQVIFCPTVSKANDIRPIGLGDYRPSSLRMNPVAVPRQIRFVNKKNALPDMVNEAVALDHYAKSYNLSSSDEEKYRPVHQTTVQRHSSSPRGHDYETDSLERTSNLKNTVNSLEYSEVPSSQASPSLSTALPLEEEMTMRNDVYKTNSSSNSNTPSPQIDICDNQNHYETIGKKITNKQHDQRKDYSLVSEVYVNNNFGSTPSSPSESNSSLGSRKVIGAVSNNIDERPGCLTIEVKDSPENYIKIQESDGFEPDTLDRKYQKHKEIISNININNVVASNKKSVKLDKLHKEVKEIDQEHDRCISLKNDLAYRNKTKILRSNSVLRNDIKDLNTKVDDTWVDTEDWVEEEGRILTLELRHSKRQRQVTSSSIKQIKPLARPDILPPLPPTEDPIYEQPIFPPRKVELNTATLTKKNNDRGFRTFFKNKLEKKTESFLNKTGQSISCSPNLVSLQKHEPLDNRNFKKPNEINRTSSRRKSVGGSCREINTNTFLKSQREDGYSKQRIRRNRGVNVDDSGYLSSDSTCSRKFQRKVTVAKIVSCSESDDTENEARSESGAESVETHSVYFGSYRKQDDSVVNNTCVKSDTKKRLKTSNK